MCMDGENPLVPDFQEDLLLGFYRFALGVNETTLGKNRNGKSNVETKIEPLPTVFEIPYFQIIYRCLSRVRNIE